MKILLINPPLNFKLIMHPPMPPYGLALIAAVLEKEGHQVNILDIDALKLSKKEVQKRLLYTDYDVVGITSYLTSFTYLEWLTKTIREIKSNINIIIGGSLASSFPKTVLENTKANIVVVGEAENTIKELIYKIQEGQDLKSVKGIFIKNNNNLFYTGEPILPENLDAIPFPAWHLFPLKAYFEDKVSSEVEKNFGLRTMTSRGCPYNCKYCALILGRRMRYRTIENVISELEYYKKEYKLTTIYLRDDIFTVDRSRVIEFCNALIRKEIDMKWGCVTSVKHLDQELLKIMRRAGCSFIAVGIESFSDNILRRMGRPVNAKMMIEAIKNIQKTDIEVIGFFIVGYPGENKETINTTLRYIKELKIKATANLILPLPGTKLYEEVKKQNRLPDEVKLLREFADENLREKVIINFTDLPDEILSETVRKINSFNR